MEKPKFKQVLKLKRAFRLVWGVVPGWTVARIFLLFIQGVLPLLTLYLMKLFVDAVMAGMESPDKAAAFRGVVTLILFMAGVALFNSLMGLVSSLVNEIQSRLVTDHVFDILHEKSIQVDLEYYENPQYYDTLRRAQHEAPHRPTQIISHLVRTAQSGVSLAAMVGLLISFHWIVAAVLFLSVIPGILVRMRYSNKMFNWERQRTSSEREGWYFHWLLTGEMYAKEIRLYNLGDLLKERFGKIRRLLRKEKFALITKRSSLDLAAQVVAIAAVFGSVGFIGYNALLGAISLGALVMYYQAFQRGQSFLKEMLGGMASLYEDNLFLSYLYDFLDLKPKVVSPLKAEPVPKPMKSGIVFDHVDFKYPMGSKKVLDDISLSIPKGKIVALVGANGSGKTTLVKLLCRLYDPTTGKVAMDGIDLRELDASDLRREISVIFQDYVRYFLSAKENIWFGNIDIAPDEEKIIKAAKSSGAHNIIKRLPSGYETMLGNWFQGGEELSVGEWQKVALARAFLRDSQIIVLDEPTSSLDAQAEYNVFEKFRDLTGDKTALVISHRFSTVKMADYIYVLNEGKIVESGNHEALIDNGGVYARLYEYQAKNFR